MKNLPKYVLGIETSCDETAAAILENGNKIRSSIVASQTELHEEYGGVVPEIACRAHVEAILPVMESACEEANVELEEIDLVGVTHTPGLIGSLLIGLQAAKSLSVALSKPFVGVDHIQAHLHSCALAAHDEDRVDIEDFPFPQVGLVVSGGHTGLYHMNGHGSYEKLGSTIDDAAGEAFDKVASLLNLSYPGGPAIQEAAENGNPEAVDFPRPMIDSPNYNFSFSGLKTAVLYHLGGQDQTNRNPDVPEEKVPDIAASFQESVVDVLITKIQRALSEFDAEGISVGGGVAANKRFRNRLSDLADDEDLPLFIPPISLCTDNAAMIAGRAYYRIQTGSPSPLNMDAIPT